MMPNAPNINFLLNQQYSEACAAAQQAWMLEASGNAMGAAQMYEQALGVLWNSMTMAGQSGVFIPDSILYTFGYWHLTAARVESSMGWPQAPAHLAMALDALNRAIAINPNLFQYHAVAGAVLAAQGSFAWAVQAFTRALQLNPADVWSRYMLSAMYSAQGNMAMAGQNFAAVQQVAPNLPSPQQFLPQAPASAPAGPGSPAPARDHLETVSKVMDILKTFTDVVNNVKGWGGGSSGAGGFPNFSF
ncbi:MAG TPA: tetratricopeptide repeat protein [Bryobacteraceae bacterium]|jgi:tetratricopeptide (TPR) repeat protein